MNAPLAYFSAELLLSVLSLYVACQIGNYRVCRSLRHLIKVAQVAMFAFLVCQLLKKWNWHAHCNTESPILKVARLAWKNRQPQPRFAIIAPKKQQFD